MDTLKEELQENVTVEEIFEQLDEILKKMDEKNVSLEDAFSLYEQGLKKVKQCNEKLDLVEKKMILLTQKDGAE